VLPTEQRFIRLRLIAGGFEGADAIPKSLLQPPPRQA